MSDVMVESQVDEPKVEPQATPETEKVRYEIREDGTITIDFDTPISFELIEAKLAAEPVELRHQMYDEGVVASPQFMRELAMAYVDEGIVSPCTSTVAYAVYSVVNDAYADFKKKFIG